MTRGREPSAKENLLKSKLSDFGNRKAKRGGETWEKGEAGWGGD